MKEFFFLVNDTDNSIIDRCLASSIVEAQTLFESKNYDMSNKTIMSEADYKDELDLIAFENQSTEF